MREAALPSFSRVTECPECGAPLKITNTPAHVIRQCSEDFAHYISENPVPPERKHLMLVTKPKSLLIHPADGAAEPVANDVMAAFVHTKKSEPDADADVMAGFVATKKESAAGSPVELSVELDGGEPSADDLETYADEYHERIALKVESGTPERDAQRETIAEMGDPRSWLAKRRETSEQMSEVE